MNILNSIRFGNNHTIYYKDLSMTLRWDEEQMKEGYEIYNHIFNTNLEKYENSDVVKDETTTAVLITLLFYETIVNKKGGLSNRIIQSRLNCEQNPGPSEAKIQDSMAKLLKSQLVKATNGLSRPLAIELKCGIKHEYLSSTKKTHKAPLYRINDLEKIKPTKIRRVGKAAAIKGYSLNNSKVFEKNAEYQKAYIEGFNEALKRKLPSTCPSSVALEPNKRKVVISLDDSVEESINFSTKDLKKVRFSTSQNRQVTDCFIPLFSPAEINDEAYAIRLILAYQKGHPSVCNYINSAKQAIQAENDESLNQSLRQFKSETLILPEEMSEIEVAAYSYQNGGYLPLNKLRKHPNPLIKFALIEKDGIWHYLTEIQQ